MAIYRVTSKTFIAPWTYIEGEHVEVPDDFVPGPHLEPVDAPAKAAYVAYENAFIKAQNHVPSLTPVEQLPKTVEDLRPKPPQPSRALTVEEVAKLRPTAKPADPISTLEAKKRADAEIAAKVAAAKAADAAEAGANG